MKQFSAISQLNASSRTAGDPMVRSISGDCLTDWQAFCRQLAILRSWLAARSEPVWLVHTHDTDLFLVAALALMQLGRELVVPGSLQPGLVDAVRKDYAASGLLSDEDFPGAVDLRCLRQAAAGQAAGVFNAWQAAGGDNPELDFLPVDPERTRMVLYTSGSTGQPKAVPKRLEQVEAEVRNLHRQWGASLEGATVWATVSHQHFYGMLFQAFLPLCAGAAIGGERISYPETFAALVEPSVAVVCSPAFYKRLAETSGIDCRFARPPLLFSSGGVLPPEIAVQVKALTGAPVNEIYGSTETGGIAWRAAPDIQAWQVFPGNKVRINEEGVIEFRSPYLFDTGYYLTSDRGRIDGEGSLVLEGRVDTIVKIEEKRVALNEVENRLRENPLVADAAVLALEHGRQFLAALIVPSAAGHERFATLTKHECNQLLRDWLHQWFEATVLPRKWRFVDALPLNTQGKRDRLAMEALFAAPKPPALPAGVNEPEILSVEQSEGRLVLGLRFSSDCLWFQGHFPGFPILPAVAQIDWLMTCAQRYLGVKADMCRMPRLKFLQPVRPDKPVFLEIDWAPAAHQLNFRYVSQGTGDVLSVGKIYLEQST